MGNIFVTWMNVKWNLRSAEKVKCVYKKSNAFLNESFHISVHILYSSTSIFASLCKQNRRTSILAKNLQQQFFFFFFFFLQYNENAPKMGDFVWIFLKLFSAWYLWKREAANQVKLFLCLDKISISSLFLKKAWNWGKFVVLQMVIYYISSLKNNWPLKAKKSFGGLLLILSNLLS